MTSSRPSTCTPDWVLPARADRRGARTVVGSCSSRVGSTSSRWRRRRSATALPDTWCSPMAAYRASRSAYLSSSATSSSVFDCWIFCTGRPSRRMALSSSSEPDSMASSRRSFENHLRILLAARWVTTNFSQSRDGPDAAHLGGEDLDGVAREQLGVERHQAAVDPGPDAGVADLGVDGVGEVDRRGALGQGDHPALRGEDEDLVLLEVDLQVGHELGGVGGLGLPVDDAVQPGQVGGAAVVVLVVPVGGDAVLGPLVHLLGADLHLERLALGPHHRRVQRLVEVELGHGDVVLEPPLHRLPRGVDGAQRGVAVLHRLDDDPDADEVEDLVEVAGPSRPSSRRCSTGASAGR